MYICVVCVLIFKGVPTRIHFQIAISLTFNYHFYYLQLIGEAVFARTLSAQKNERVEASKHLPAPADTPLGMSRQQVCVLVMFTLLARTHTCTHTRSRPTR